VPLGHLESGTAILLELVLTDLCRKFVTVDYKTCKQFFTNIQEWRGNILILTTLFDINTTYNDLTDEEIIQLVHSGDNDALEYIFERYRGYIKAKSRIYFLIGGDRDDIEQEGMLGLYGAIKGYKNEKEYAFKTFAEICITRQILTAIKTATRRKHIPLNSYISLNRVIYAEENDKATLIDAIEENTSNNPEDILICKESCISLENRIISKLSKLELKILKLYVNGRTYEQIGKIIHKDKKAVDNALQRIRKKIIN